MRWFHSQRVLGAQFGNGLRFFCADFQVVVYLLKYVKIVGGIVFMLIFVPIKQTQTMTTNTITKELYESPMKERNEEKYGLLTEQCICCGKPMKKGEKLYVHMNTDWQAVNPTISEKDCKELTGAESQGCFPIGNDCAKKMQGFTFTMN